jgi:predicted methyltransferase
MSIAWRRALVLAGICAGLAAAGCAAREPRPVAPGDEPSAKPGINKPYFENPNPEKWTERFETESREVYRARDRIVAELGMRSGSVVADVGAGSGLFTMLLAKAVGPKGRVYAVDIVPEFLPNIAQRARQEGLGNVETVLCTEKSVELQPGSIDGAFICDTYHHFEYPRHTLVSLWGALRPGGWVAVVDFERIEGRSSEWVLGHVRCGKDVVRREFEEAGFEFVCEADMRPALEENYLVIFRKRGR